MGKENKIYKDGIAITVLENEDSLKKKKKVVFLKLCVPLPFFTVVAIATWSGRRMESQGVPIAYDIKMFRKNQDRRL